MSIQFIHLADMHYDRENQDAAAKSLEHAITIGREHKISFWALSGDLFNRGIQNTEAGGLPRLLDLIQRMLDIAPIAAVEGTKTHDLPGSYSPFQRLTGKGGEHNFHLLDPGKTYFFDTFNDCISSTYVEGQMGALLLGCSEPGKEWFLAGTNGIGKEEADRRVVEGMKKILLGTGALRAEYPDLPCVFLYHGGVAGASMANGQLVEGGITIGREDLALVGADYYALGHIHLAQQVGDLPAYYSGSAYPVNWGETDQKSCNLVTIEEIEVETEDTEFGKGGLVRDAKIVAIPFPHPPRKKLTGAVIDLYFGFEFAGFQTWIDVRDTKENLATITTDEVLAYALKNGALPGSRVTFELIPTETVRDERITDAHSLREKLIRLAKAEGQEGVRESILLKADQLEHEAFESGTTPVGAHMRLRKGRVRGHKAHKKGLDAEELVLDLDQYEPGLIPLISPNGTGKTAFMENLQPFPQEFSAARDGKLQDNFWMRDSTRELWYRDERNGDEYRFLMQIDGATKNGGVDYFAFKNNVPLPREEGGQKADYQRHIERLFGSVPMFLRRAFETQEPSNGNKRLRRATVGERQEVFRELAGLDYQQGYADNAKTQGDATEKNIENERIAINLIESQLTALPGIREDMEGKRTSHAAAVVDLSSLEIRGKACKVEVEAFAEKVRAQESLAQRIAGLEDQAAQKRQVIAQADNLIAGYAEATKQAPAAQKIVDEWTRLTAEEGKENARITKINAERARLGAEYGNALKAHSENVKGLDATRTSLRAEKARLEADLRILGAQIDTLTGNLKQAIPALVDSCPRCGQKLPPDLLAVEQNRHADEVLNRAEMEKNLIISREKLTETTKSIESKQAEIDAIKDPTPPVDETPAEPSKTELQRITAALSMLKIVEARQTLTAAQGAAVRTEEARKHRDEANTGLYKLDAEVVYVRGQLDPSVAPAHEAAVEKYEQARRDYSTAREGIVSLEAQIKEREQRITELEAQEQDLGERKKKISIDQSELSDWRWLQRGCGRNGIQAQELKEMGPSIAEEGNKLLAIAHDMSACLPDLRERNHFDLIQFKMDDMAGKGSKTHQVPDFDIVCHDVRDDTWVSFTLISPGEAVWVDEAIEAAFAIVNEKNNGSRMLTIMHDEKDAALDPVKRRIFIAMLQAAHQASGRWHTILITHSPEIQEMLPQKIIMSELVRIAHAA